MRNRFLIFEPLLLLIIVGIVIQLFLLSKERKFKTADCYLISAHQIFDGLELNEDFSVKIANGLIVEFALDINKNTSNTCETINLKNTFITPGLIDSHTHLLAYDKHNVRTWQEALEESAGRNPALRIDQGVINANSMLAYGFTTVRDLGNSGYFLDAQLNAKKLPLEIIYSGPGIAVAPSQINLPAGSQEYLVIASLDDFKKSIADYQNHGAQWIKLYGDNSAKQGSMPPTLMKEIIHEAHSLNFKVAVHAETTDSVQSAIETGADSVEHVSEIPGSFDKNVVQTRPFAVVTDISNKACRAVVSKMQNQPQCRNVLDARKNRIEWLRKNNFEIVFGSDAVLDFTSNYQSRGQASLEALLSFAEAGLGPVETLKAATSTPGKMLSKKIGLIKPGFQADLVGFEESPIKDLSAMRTVTFILKNGKIICDSKRSCSRLKESL